MITQIRNEPISPFPYREAMPSLAYLDNAATTQKPVVVLDALAEAYTKYCANPYRSIYRLAEEATLLLERTRSQISDFIGGSATGRVIFTSNTTNAVNMAANAWLLPRLQSGDTVIVTELEHHSNYLPWLMACSQSGANLRVVPTDLSGALDLDYLETILKTEKVRLLALTHASNVLGVSPPIKAITHLAKLNGNIPVFVDGAQAIPHLPVNVTELGCDFYAFSPHKAYGPNGVGILWVRDERIAEMTPCWPGGGTVEQVDDGGIIWLSPPHCFEPGTLPLPEIIATGAALEFLTENGSETSCRLLFSLMREGLASIPGVHVYGPPHPEVPICSFTVDGIHPHDVAAILDSVDVAVRAGTHCAQPLMRRLGVNGTVRASLGLNNSEQDIHRLLAGVRHAKEVFGGIS